MVENCISGQILLNYQRVLSPPSLNHRHFSCAQFINESPEAELVATIWPTELDVLQAKHAMKQGITELDKCT